MDLARKRYYRRGAVLLAVWLTVWVSVTLVWNHFDMDRRIIAEVWSPETGWALGKQEPWAWLHKYGTMPGFLLTFALLVVWYRSLHSRKWVRFRRYFLLYSLTSIVGAGLIVNALLKEYTGRPRPREVIEFGGRWEYKAALELGTAGQGQSFPCGHCTMGFVFASGVMLWTTSPPLALGLLGVGLTYGTIVSTARLFQGAHYVSDAFWSLGVLGATFIVLFFFVLQPPLSEREEFRPLSRREKWRLGGGTAAFLLVMTALYLTRRPFFEEHRKGVDVAESIQQLEIHSTLTGDEWTIEYVPTARVQLSLQASGFAFPQSEHELAWRAEAREETLRLVVKTESFGYFSELREEAVLQVPERLREHLTFSAERP
jgi:membrane-associated PAP2 superfamily phosphatase